MRLQAVGATFLLWRRAFCIMNLRVTFSGKVKGLEIRSRSESESEQGAVPRKGTLVGRSRRETKWSTLGQVEVQVTLYGGPNR